MAQFYKAGYTKLSSTSALCQLQCFTSTLQHVQGSFSWPLCFHCWEVQNTRWSCSSWPICAPKWISQRLISLCPAVKHNLTLRPLTLSSYASWWLRSWLEGQSWKTRPTRDLWVSFESWEVPSGRYTCLRVQLCHRAQLKENLDLIVDFSKPLPLKW